MIPRLLHLLADTAGHLRPAGEWAASWAGNALVGFALQWLAGMTQ